MGLYRTAQTLGPTTVLLRGLPVGWAVTTDGGVVPAPASGLVTLPGPVTFLHILNDQGAVVAAPEAAVQAGDEYLYVSPLVEWLYDRLPEMTRARDVESGAFFQLLQVLGAGLQPAKDAADQLLDLVDADTCPAPLLPALGAMLGFEFPYDLSEAQQRNFIRSIISLYRIKGTPSAMKLLVARLIAGQGIGIDIVETNSYLTKTFDFILTLDENQAVAQTLQDRIQYLIEAFSPAGMIPTRQIRTYTTEQARGSTGDAVQTTTIVTPWRVNMGHRVNYRTPEGYTVSVNNQGYSTAAI